MGITVDSVSPKGLVNYNSKKVKKKSVSIAEEAVRSGEKRSIFRSKSEVKGRATHSRKFRPTIMTLSQVSLQKPQLHLNSEPLLGNEDDEDELLLTSKGTVIRCIVLPLP